MRHPVTALVSNLRVNVCLTQPGTEGYDAFEKMYRERTGRVRFTGDVESSERARVTVAVIDSAAHAYISERPDTFGHGRAVGRVAVDLACGDSISNCPVRVSNHLALPNVDLDTVDLENGGYFGSRGTLAQAIEEAVQEWKAHQVKSKLIINLSLGWTPEADAQTPHAAGNEAVHVALQRAACEGALIFAAAGNKTPVSKHGPLYPAAWESEPAPDDQTCAALGVARANPSQRNKRAEAEGSVPLLYAVSGVDQNDIPLLSTKIGGQARMAAYGLSVIVDDVRENVAFTGSSMATAVASGVAAAAWSFAPDMSAAELAATLYERAPHLDSSLNVAAVCLGGQNCEAHRVRRLSACDALNAVGVKSTCVPPSKVVLPAANVSPPAFATCSGTLCPPIRADDATTSAWVNPQPGDPICPSCMINKSQLKLNGTLAVNAANNSNYLWLTRYSSVYVVSEQGENRPIGATAVNMPLSPEVPGYPTTQGDLSLWLFLGATWVPLGSQQVPVQ